MQTVGAVEHEDLEGWNPHVQQGRSFVDVLLEDGCDMEGIIDKSAAIGCCQNFGKISLYGPDLFR